MGLVYLNIGEVYREQNQFEQAKSYLKQGLELCRPFEAWHAGVTSGVISLARLLAAEGLPDQALAVLLEIEQQPSPAAPVEQARLEAVRARLLLGQGSYNAAARWARRSGLSAADEVDYSHEFDYLTLARVLIAQAGLEAQGIHPLSLAADPLESADSLLKRLYSMALSGGRMGRVIEVCLLQALIQALRTEITRALLRLEEALNLAEPEGYVRLLADEGWPVYRLLTLLLTKPLAAVSVDYTRTLLAAFPQAVGQSGQASSLIGSALTGRELRTLRLLAAELPIEEIAAEMTVSVSTVRTYAKRIYSKLDVHSRAEAVYRAKALKLL
jgi:LuxR family maltose regulon positive regulatory protein